MPITLTYSPGLLPAGNAAYQAGLGDYRRFLQGQQLSRDLQNQQLGQQRDLQLQQLQQRSWETLVNDARSAYTAELGAANSRYLGDLSAWDAQTRQGTQITADEATQRRNLDAAREQQLRSIEDAQYRQDLDLANQRFLSEYSAWDAQTRQHNQLTADAQSTAAQLAAAQARQTEQLYAQRFGQMASLQAQAANLQSELANRRDLAAFGLQGDLVKQQQAAYLQSGLSGQGAGQDWNMQLLRGQQAQDLAQFEQTGRMDQAQNQFLQENFLGPYAGYADTISARQGYLQDQQLQQKLTALEGNRHLLTPMDYQIARNEILQQRFGLQQKIGGDQQLRQAQVDSHRYQVTLPSGETAIGYWDGSGVPQLVEDPTLRHFNNAQESKARLEAEYAARQLDARTKALEYASKLATRRDPYGEESLDSDLFNAHLEKLETYLGLPRGAAAPAPGIMAR